MKFSLDFDGTYTADPEMWIKWIEMVHALGHEVYCITYRPPHKMQKVIASVGAHIGAARCISTGYTAKKQHAESIGLQIDVWIDDTPEMVVTAELIDRWHDTPY